ncbi:hypothetical protein ACTWLT_31200 [Micromonospora sp. ZYX-F-536]|uniref:hypothetical protein n=1 Tax=Micromonospora sp. ZYX-F-536 TaxID=3457629 RepID=UPI0040409E4C
MTRDTPEPAGSAAEEKQYQSGDASPPASAAADTPADGAVPQPLREADAPEPNPAVDAGGTPADPVSEAPQDGSEVGEAPGGEGRPGTARRTGGSLRGAVLDILEAHPERQYKTSELCKLVDAANAGTGAAKASAGAVANAVTKLVAAGTAVQTVERPATYQLAPATGGR